MTDKRHDHILRKMRISCLQRAKVSAWNSIVINYEERRLARSTIKRVFNIMMKKDLKKGMRSWYYLLDEERRKDAVVLKFLKRWTYKQNY